MSDDIVMARRIAEQIALISAEIHRLREDARAAGAGWQDISTAPKDGTWIELYRPPAESGLWECRVKARWYQPEDAEAAWAWPDELYDLETEEDRQRANALIEAGDCWEDAENFTHWRSLSGPPAAPSPPTEKHNAG